VTLEEGLELINNYKKGLEKFLETLPEQSVQLGSEMIQTLTLNSKNQIANLEAIEKSHKKMNGKLREELDLEKKNHAIAKEDAQLKDIEIGRMMEKLHK